MSKPSRIDFLDQVADYVAVRFPLVKVEKLEADFALKLNGNWTSLENLYRTVVHDPMQLPKHVDRWVTELLRAAEGQPDERASFDEMKGRIMPMVLSRGRRDVAGPAMVKQEILPGLFVAYAIDNEKTIAYIPEKTFDAWGMELDDLHETAIDNLIAKSEELQAQASADNEGKVHVVYFQTMDGYDASRILLPQLHERLREYLGSPFVVGIPNRDILLCFRDEADVRDVMRKQIAEGYAT